MDPIIKTENIKVIYNRGQDNEYIALNDISIEVFPQEYTIFFGPSGCGKSTLLYTILGLQRLSEGKLYIQGRDSASFTEEEKSKMSSQFFGIVFQNFNLIYSLNVIDNIALPQVFIEANQEERLAKAQSLLTRFGIATRAKNLPASLSGGQQQRVAICRSLINDPLILLADEPVGNLDSESARIVMQSLYDINKKDKKTVILVTHDPSYLPYADRVYYFKDAKFEKVVQNRNPKKMVNGGIEIKPKGKEDENGESDLLGELEKLARVHHFMTVPQLKAWSITNYLIDDFTINQVERLEQFMEEMLAGKLSQHAFFENLNTPYNEGGVGLYKGTAIRFVKETAAILKQVNEFLAEVKKHNNSDNNIKILSMLSRFLLQEHRGNLKAEEIERFEAGIRDRLNGSMNSVQFSKLLHKHFADGGVGLSVTTAEHLSERLQIILTQAYEVH
ncbi:MAG TPA: ABC transporter ATP-binding protein [Candidatus Udaeobacter sp.]|nr:ABC transporter ATP-binding protein [Candidatus Udaeobacter sp.]